MRDEQQLLFFCLCHQNPRKDVVRLAAVEKTDKHTFLPDRLPGPSPHAVLQYLLPLGPDVPYPQTTGFLPPTELVSMTFLSYGACGDEWKALWS